MKVTFNDITEFKCQPYTIISIYFMSLLRWAYSFFVLLFKNFALIFNFHFQSQWGTNAIAFVLHKCAVSKSQESGAKSSSTQSKSAVDSEFVSDTFQTTEKDLDEVKAGMKLLGIDSLANQSKKDNGKIQQWTSFDETKNCY